jgi:hypothetical protein
MMPFLFAPVRHCLEAVVWSEKKVKRELNWRERR